MKNDISNNELTKVNLNDRLAGLGVEIPFQRAPQTGEPARSVDFEALVAECIADDRPTLIRIMDGLEELARDRATWAGIKDELLRRGILTKVGIEIVEKRVVAKVDGPPPPCPPISDITAIQAALFDNGPKARGSRYGMAIEIWTKPGDQIGLERRTLNYDWKTSIPLMDYRSLKNYVKVLRRPRKSGNISDAYLNGLSELADIAGEKDQLVGLFVTKILDDDQPYKRGNYYHDAQFVLVDPKNNYATDICAHGRLIRLSPMSSLDRGGNSHHGNVIRQSRTALVDLPDQGWDTRHV